jgi:hypothetical protein
MRGVPTGSLARSHQQRTGEHAPDAFHRETPSPTTFLGSPRSLVAPRAAHKPTGPHRFRLTQPPPIPGPHHQEAP